jgi:hypothetical protein
MPARAKVDAKHVTSPLALRPSSIANSAVPSPADTRSVFSPGCKS